MPLHFSLGSALFAPLLGRRREAAAPSRAIVPCPHCRSVEAAFPSGSAARALPLVCRECGGWRGADGAPRRICPECASLAEGRRRDHDGCPGAPAGGLALPSLEAAERLEAALLAQLDASRGLVRAPSVERYLVHVLEEAGWPRRTRPALLDLGEPLLAALPAGGLCVSLGLLAALEDEAQLAFVLAREAWLWEAGWVARRFAAARAAARGLRARLPWVGDDPLGHALDVSLRLGYGAVAEASADREALAVLVRADYWPQAGPRAFELLEAASLAGRGARFVSGRERRRWLERGALSLGLPPTARLNREVYRRAVGGFAVFSAARS